MFELPIYPLNQVAFPAIRLTLRIAEESYREMIRSVMAGDRRLGVCFCDGNALADVGTIVEVVLCHHHGDGSVALTCVGICRFRALEFVQYRPYPLANACELEDVEENEASSSAPVSLEELPRRLRRCRDLVLNYLRFLPATQREVDKGMVAEMPWNPQWEHQHVPNKEERRMATQFSLWCAMILPLARDERQRILQCVSLIQRLRTIEYCAPHNIPGRETHENETRHMVSGSIPSLFDMCLTCLATHDSAIDEAVHVLAEESLQGLLRLMRRRKRVDSHVMDVLRHRTHLQELSLHASPFFTRDWVRDYIAHFSSLRSLDMANCYALKAVDVDFLIVSLPCLTDLSLDRVKSVNDWAMRNVTRLTNLRVLRIGGTKITDETIKGVRTLTGLRILDLSCDNVTDTSLLLISRSLTHLNELHVPLTKVGNHGCQALGFMTTLKTLDLSLNPRIRNDGVRRLQTLTGLVALNLSINSAISTAGVSSLSGLTSLETLNLSKTDINDTIAPVLACFTRLKSLDLSRTAVGDEGLRVLSSLPELRTLVLCYCEVTDACIPSMVFHSSLVSLHMTGCVGITDWGVQTLLASLHDLRSLDLGGCQLTNRALQGIEGLHHLRSLSLWNTEITATGVARIIEQTGLMFDDRMKTTRGTYLFTDRGV